MPKEKKVPADLCEIPHFHRESIIQTVEHLPEDDVILRLADIFKLTSDMTRLKIVLALLGNELCVCDLCHVVGIGQSAVSHQLRILRGASLVKFRKEGKMVYYSINDDHVAGIIQLALEHLKHTMPGMEK